MALLQSRPGSATKDHENGYIQTARTGNRARRRVGILARLRGTYDIAKIIMFGSRARGDFRPDNDLDLAIVLGGRRGDFIETKLDMAGIAFDVLMETGVLVQPFPLWDGDLAHPERFANRALIQNISRDGIRLG